MTNPAPARTPKSHAGEEARGAEHILVAVFGLHRAPDAHAAVYAREGLDREEIPDVEMVVDEQGDLHVERTHGHVVDVAVDFGGGPAAAARKADARFEVEGQAAVEQDLVRHGEVESRARTGVYPHVFDRDGAGRHVDAGADAQDVLLIPLRPDGSRRQQDEQDECVSFHGGR